MIFVYRTSPVGPSGIPLSDYAEGDIIKLNEGGSPVEFYVAKHDYESGLNGAGRTLVVRKECYDNRVWNSGGTNAYASSDLDAWFNGTYKNLLDPAIQTAIGTTKFYYTPGNGNNTVTTLERAVFALSLTELGISSTNPPANIEGSSLPIASILTDNPALQWTRSPVTNGTNSAWWSQYGSHNSNITSASRDSRPIFTLPSTLLFNPDTNEVVS